MTLFGHPGAWDDPAWPPQITHTQRQWCTQRLVLPYDPGQRKNNRQHSGCCMVLFPLLFHSAELCHVFSAQQAKTSVSLCWKHPFVPLTSSGIKSILCQRLPRAGSNTTCLNKYGLPHHSASLNLYSHFTTQQWGVETQVSYRSPRTTKTMSHLYRFLCCCSSLSQIKNNS